LNYFVHSPLRCREGALSPLNTTYNPLYGKKMPVLYW
jgi:hypothetical protein